MTPSPLAPKSYPTLPAIDGVKLAAGNAGIRYTGRPDVLLVECAPGTAVAGVLTRSLTASASVLKCREYLPGGEGRVLVVNAGNSNAFTGKAGDASVARIIGAAATLAAVPQHTVFTSSTGVIGQKLDDAKITALLNTLHGQLSDTAWSEAAAAILTTDTFPKRATVTVNIGGIAATINGFAKGSGMIAPDMATMLAYFFTDANLAPAALQKAFEAANAASFNCITVDGDTSTSDTALIFATGKAGHPKIHSESDSGYTEFQQALQRIMTELAQQVVKDGEGASKFVTITVTGAEHDAAARRIAMSIANSPLVKTAISGGDANWGRVVMAVGKAGEKADRDLLTITFGGQVAAKEGQLNPEYNDEAATRHLAGQHIDIGVDIGIGAGKSVVWTCDLTHGYIDINGSYRT